MEVVVSNLMDIKVRFTCNALNYKNSKLKKMTNDHITRSLSFFFLHFRKCLYFLG